MVGGLLFIQDGMLGFAWDTGCHKNVRREDSNDTGHREKRVCIAVCRYESPMSVDRGANNGSDGWERFDEVYDICEYERVWR